MSVPSLPPVRYKELLSLVSNEHCVRAQSSAVLWMWLERWGGASTLFAVERGEVEAELPLFICNQRAIVSRALYFYYGTFWKKVFSVVFFGLIFTVCSQMNSMFI